VVVEKGKFLGITDLHIYQHSNSLTLTAIYKDHQEHLDRDLRQTVEDFGETLGYFYRKLQQKWG
jgi:hypothetical protein